jgi:transcriptional regulator with XRE-family HTH domain
MSGIFSTCEIIYSTKAIVPAIFRFVNTLLHQISIYFSRMENFHTKVEVNMVIWNQTVAIASLRRGTMSEEEEIRSSQFAEWLNQQLQRHGWTQGRLISQSGSTKEERLSSAAVSRYCTGKMLPDAASCQKIARAFDVPVELVLRKAGLISTPFSDESDWLQRALDDLAYAVEVGQLSEEGRLALTAHIRRERLLQALERTKERQNGRREETEQHSPS